MAAGLPNAQLVEPPWGDTEWIDRQAARDEGRSVLLAGTEWAHGARDELALDLEQRIEASDRLQCDRRDRFALLAFPSILLDVSQLEEAPPRMGKAKRRRNRQHLLLRVEQRLGPEACRPPPNETIRSRPRMTIQVGRIAIR